jgi:signal transduction histidine kinase
MRISKARLDSIRMWSNDFIAFEQTLLDERNEELEQRYFINDVIRFSSFTLIGITSLAALFTILSKERDNARLLKELQQFNLQLELKVKERTHELLEANRDLIQLNEEKNNFLAITTHDLKAPLAGITSLLNVMKLDADTLSIKHRSYLACYCFGEIFCLSALPRMGRNGFCFYGFLFFYSGVTALIVDVYGFDFFWVFRWWRILRE